MRQLLSRPPKTEKQKISDGWGTVIGTAGYQPTIFNNGYINSHDKDTNQLLRAYVACHLGLSEVPNEANTYIAELPLNDQNSNTSLTPGK